MSNNKYMYDGIWYNENVMNVCIIHHNHQMKMSLIRQDMNHHTLRMEIIHSLFEYSIL